MLTLHYLEKSRAFRILWALEELQQGYEIKCYRRTKTYSAPPELKKVHPLGYSPILQDNDSIVAESAVILEYLQNKYDSLNQFKPQDDKEAFQYLYWMHYSEASLMPLLVFYLVMDKVDEKVTFLVRFIAKKITDGIKSSFIQPRLDNHIAFIEQHLSKNSYFAGEFSFADIQMAFPLEAIAARVPGKHPNIEAFLKRIAQRSAYQRAKQKDPA